MSQKPFPHELVERVLALLDAKSMVTCRLVNKQFNDLIQSSPLLQFSLACNAAGLIHNPRSPFSFPERFEALRKREDAWRRLKPMFEKTIKVKHQPSSFYCLTGGTFFLSDSNGRDLHYCRLPSSPQDDVRWTKIPVHGPEESWHGQHGIFVGFAVAIYEHDLIINIISVDTGNEENVERYSLELVLLKLSNGKYHPLARHPRIHVQRSPDAQPSMVNAEIAGDNLALLVKTRYHEAFPDRLFIFDWKTGHKRLQHEANDPEYEDYTDLVFISTELLLVPNRIQVQAHFEIWHIPPSYLEPPTQILSLRLPDVSFVLISLFYAGNPNPFHTMPYFPPRPFFPSLEKSIIIVTIELEDYEGSETASYTLVMNRHALLDTIRKWTLPYLPEQHHYHSANEVTLNNIIDQNDGSTWNFARSAVAVMTPEHFRQIYGSPFLSSSPSSPSQIPVASRSPTTSPTSQYTFPIVSWTHWGPPISRWFLFPQVQPAEGVFSISAGQRYALAAPDPRNGRMRIKVADFNPYNCRKYVNVMTRRGEDEYNSRNGNDEEGGTELECGILEDDGVFSEDVHMELKGILHRAPKKYNFDRLLMDEERLLGVKLNAEGKIKSVKVLYFG